MIKYSNEYMYPNNHLLSLEIETHQNAYFIKKPLNCSHQKILIQNDFGFTKKDQH